MHEGAQSEGVIGVLIEEHFDETEFRRFNEVFPANGYGVEYISHLWGQAELTFTGNEYSAKVTVSKEIEDIDLDDYCAVILIGGYAMDRLRYQEHPVNGAPNQAPAVRFLRAAVQEMDTSNLKIGTICHSMWLFCASPELLQGRRVTCAHNIICDVQNAGGVVVFDGDQTADVCIDGGLISARHPGVVDQFVEALLTQLADRRVTG